MYQQTLDLEQFTHKLPNRPYCSDNLEMGLQIRPKQLALLKRYIQPNHPYYTNFLVFDLDYSTAYVDYFYSMIGVPAPNLIVENPENGHAHYIYQLKTPIYQTDASKPKPIQYANAIYLALRDALQADVNYSGLITKNALHEHWRTYLLREQPYTLNQLSEHLELTSQQIQKDISTEEAVGLGRNCCVFNKVRHWAYVEIRKYRGKTYQQWFDAVIAQCCSINVQFSVPMQYNEVKGIAKSISRWTWKRDAYCYAMFIDRQSMKGKKGGLAKSSKYDDKRKQAQEMHNQGMKQIDIAKILGVTTRTLRNWQSGK